MTGEEALEIIRAYKKKLKNSCSNQLDEDIKAFDNAIKALKYDRDQYQKGLEDAIRVLKPMCRHLGKMWGDPETDRCDLDDKECHCQCIWRQND